MRELSPDEVKAALEHREVLQDLKSVLASAAGRRLFKYLFKHLEVAELPMMGLEGLLLMDKMGFLRAGNAIFKLAAEADAQAAASILAEKEKELYAQRLAAYEDGQS
jgi:hypothetical protein